MKQFIKTSIKKIKHAIDNNKLVIFVGAGVSANSKCPSWTSLVDRFADELGIPEEDRNQSIEYYLKVPQYYYIERGEKEYFDLVDQTINNFDPVPNDINKIIFNLNPCTVITTNFDDLLEKTVKSEGHFYTTIRQDKDLPYCINDNLVIKMHGDGKLKNIILKEEDYLCYSKKFPLIENYIKGLFSTKTILFVGYSAEDPDFKLLFQSVKEQLDGHFQPAYLLEYGKDEERINFNYYKNRGINILYYDKISEEIEPIIDSGLNTDIKHPLGIKLYKFLKYIKDYREDESNNYIDKVYNKLKVFEEMNAITPDDIVKVINDRCRYDHLALDDLFFWNCEELSAIVKKIKGNEKKEEVELFKSELFKNPNTVKVLNILDKASIRTIGIDRNDVILSLENDLNFNVGTSFAKDELDEMYITFDYSRLAERLKYYLADKDIEGNENNFLKKAFYLYNIGQFIEAYEILKKVSVHSFSRKKYLYYFISQFNIKQLLCFIEIDSNLSSQNNEYYNNIIQEIKSIDIEAKYMELPRQYKEKVSFITKLNSFNYFYNQALNLQEKIKSIKEQKSIIDNGGFSINNDIIRAYHDMRSFTNYINHNYITVLHFSEIKRVFDIFIESVLVNYSINLTNNKFGNVFSKIDSLNTFILDIILRYIKVDDLGKYISENNIDSIEIEEEGINYLSNTLSKMSYIKEIKQNSFNASVINHNMIISNIFVLLGYTKFSKETFVKIIDEVIKLIDYNVLDGTNFDKVLSFVVRTFNNQKELIDVEILVTLISKYIFNLCNGKLTGFSYNVIYRDLFFSELSYICKEINPESKIITEGDLIHLINDYIEKLDKDKKIDDNDSNVVKNLLIQIYPLMPEKVSSVFQEFVMLNLVTLKEKGAKYEYIVFGHNIMIKNIIKLNDKDNEIFVIEANSFIKEQVSKDETKGDTNVIKIRAVDWSNSEQVVRYLLDLFLNNKIDYSRVKDLCIDIEELFPMFKFFVNRSEFNYNDFDIDWIKYLNDNETEELLKKQDARKIICSLLSKEIEKEEVDKIYIKKAALLLEKLI